MTTTQPQDTRSVVPAQTVRSDQASGPDRRTNAIARHRSAEDEEAYRRSVMEQAKIDIAAGW